MLIALLSDIHASREAFEAVLDVAREAGAERFVILGDIVGYGPDPEWCVNTCMALSESGAIVLNGNHDQAVHDPGISMNTMARAAIIWTRNQLDSRATAFLASRPYIVTEEDRLYVHASAHRPEAWNYILSVTSAAAHFSACPARVSFCGHVHVPMLYGTSITDKIISFPPKGPDPISLPVQYRWLAVVGAVGQPRDGIASAAFCLYDTERNELTFRRAAYDFETTQRKIRAAGLPGYLADRLAVGH